MGGANPPLSETRSGMCRRATSSVQRPCLGTVRLVRYFSSDEWSSAPRRPSHEHHSRPTTTTPGYIRYVSIAVELAVISLIGVAVLRARHRLATGGVELDVPERILAVLAQTAVPRRVARIFATESSILYYALAAWRRKPFTPQGARAFSYHKQNASLAILYAILGTAIVELAALDLLLRAHHHVAANVFLVVDALAVVWILGYARAVQLRPILVTSDTLFVRGGMQWSLDVPRSAIESIAVGRVKFPDKRTPEYLRATMGQPNVLITLTCPLVATGAYGLTRRVTRLGLSVDDPNTFSLALSPTVA